MEVRSGYKQTEAGVIPENWEAEAVRDAFEIRNQLRLPLSHAVRERMSGPYPYFGPTSAQGWINEYRIEGEHALIGEDGDHFLKWRTHPMTLLVNGKFNVNNHAHVVKGTKNLTAWFYWFFVNRDICNYLTRQGASRYKLTKAALQQLPCVIPPHEEQNAITAALGDIKALLAGLDRLIAKKRDLKQAAMQRLLTGQTRLPGFQGEWDTKLLPDLADIRSGGTPSTNDPAAWDGDTAWCTPTDITALAGRKYLTSTARQITAHGLKQSSAEVIPAGSVVMTSRATIGECAINAIPMTTNQGFKNFVPFESVDAEFLYYLLTTQKAGFISLCGGSTFLEIGKAQLRSYGVRVPADKAEQTAIAAVLSDMDAELSALEARRGKTRALKQGMMQELLTGRTRLV